MKKQLLDQIIKKKENKSEFAIVTNLATGNSEIFEKGKSLSKNFEKFTDQINIFYQSKKNGIIKGTDIFIESYNRPIKVVIIGAVHIAQHLIDFAKSLNFEIFVIDPRGYFATEQRFPNIKIINKWPDEAFKEINADSNTALITLTHDSKIDDPALKHAIKRKFYYIGALGSKKTHANRCERLKKAGFSDEEINLIHGPIGINLGGKAAPEIALSIIAQLVAETYKK
jgi:xanthine dehydrogenase accessory factor